jgi:hypothetical protein
LTFIIQGLDLLNGSVEYIETKTPEGVPSGVVNIIFFIRSSTNSGSPVPAPLRLAVAKADYH